MNMHSYGYYGQQPLALQPLSLLLPGAHELEAPRTRISTACNRCRRRKIKCSGAPAGEKCEGCHRAQTECIFADKPPKLLSVEGEAAAAAAAAAATAGARGTGHGPVRHQSAGSAAIEQFRPAPTSARANSLPNVNQQLGDKLEMSVSPRARPQGSPFLNTNGATSASSPKSTKRASGPHRVASHPYARPGPASRTSSGDSAVTSNLQRYAQSLIQVQASQLHARTQQGFNLAQSASPTLMHAPTARVNQPMQAYSQQEPQFADSGFRQSFPAAHSPTAQEWILQTGYSPAASEFNTRPMQLEDARYPSLYEAPTHDFYSAATPELVSSDSLGTNATSTSSLRLPLRYDALPMAYLAPQSNQAQPQYKSHAMSMHLQQQQNFLRIQQLQQSLVAPGIDMTPAELLSDPKQWTPGAERLSQYLRFDFASSHDPSREGYHLPEQHEA